MQWHCPKCVSASPYICCLATLEFEVRHGSWSCCFFFSFPGKWHPAYNEKYSPEMLPVQYWPSGKSIKNTIQNDVMSNTKISPRSLQAVLFRIRACFAAASTGNHLLFPLVVYFKYSISSPSSVACSIIWERFLPIQSRSSQSLFTRICSSFSSKLPGFFQFL